MEDPDLILKAIAKELRRVLPADVAIATSLASIALPIPAAERQLVARAVASRQAEFVGGRWCAHRALEEIGRPTEFLAIGSLREPLWPQGATGAITHEAGLCAAVAALSSSVSSIGIDIVGTSREVDTSEFSRLIVTARDTFGTSGVTSAHERTLLCFAAKETFVKTVSAKVGRFLDLEEIETNVQEGSFTAQLSDGSLRVEGTWSRVESYFLTASLIPAGTLSR